MAVKKIEFASKINYKFIDLSNILPSKYVVVDKAKFGFILSIKENPFLDGYLGAKGFDDVEIPVHNGCYVFFTTGSEKNPFPKEYESISDVRKGLDENKLFIAACRKNSRSEILTIKLCVRKGSGVDALTEAATKQEFEYQDPSKLDFQRPTRHRQRG